MRRRRLSDQGTSRSKRQGTSDALARLVNGRFAPKIVASVVYDVLFEYQPGWAARVAPNRSHLDLAAPNEPVEYAAGVLSSYLRLSCRENFNGRCVELGPGPSMATCLGMHLLGASTVVAVDRFQPQAASLPAAETRELLRSHLLSRGYGLSEKTVNLAPESHFGRPAEDFFEDSDLFDGIYSWSVLEHLVDPERALDGMARSIAQGGVMVHSVDLRDHGLFAEIPDTHPLHFLRVRDPIYRRMSRGRGLPNRFLEPQYRQWLAESGLSGSVLIHSLVGSDVAYPGLLWEELPESDKDKAVASVAAFRAEYQLARRFESMSNQELAISGVFIVAERR